MPTQIIERRFKGQLNKKLIFSFLFNCPLKSPKTFLSGFEPLKNVNWLSPYLSAWTYLKIFHQ